MHRKRERGWDRLILACVDWTDVNELVARNQKRRESYTPVISLYRWWARRPHSMIGSILDAAVKASNSRTLRVSDPFSGGGTVALESVLRGIPVYAQELYPWPTFSLATSLSEVAIEEIEEAVTKLLRHLDPLRAEFRRADGRELTHVLRVRTGSCPACLREVFLFPYPLFSLASRNKDEVNGFFGCRRCGGVTKGRRDTRTFTCPKCDWASDVKSQRKGFIKCPHCGDEAVLHSFYRGVPTWKVVLVQESTTQKGRHKALVRQVEPSDPVDVRVATEDFLELNTRIEDGVETRRLLRAGYLSWGDLYTTRQARVLLESLQHIREMDFSPGCRDRLALAVIGAAEMPAFLSRWDRYHLKAYEGLANHRYAHTTMTVETNLLGPMGRGTLVNRLRASVRAVKWMSATMPRGVVGVRTAAPYSRVDFEADVHISTGDSSCQSLASRTVDLVLTDPPYFNDVQYGELARLFHYWLGHYRSISPVLEGREAVPNPRRGHDAKFYETVITECLQESQRTLREGGKLILTYHNRKIQAWKSLASALVESGFVVRAAAVARAENSADITKRNGKAILHDLVLECNRRSRRVDPTITFVAGESDEEREILAMGIALGEAIRQENPEKLLDLYQAQLQRFGLTGRFIKCGRKCSANTQHLLVP